MFEKRGISVRGERDTVKGELEDEGDGEGEREDVLLRGRDTDADHEKRFWITSTEEREEKNPLPIAKTAYSVTFFAILLVTFASGQH